MTKQSHKYEERLPRLRAETLSSMNHFILGKDFGVQARTPAKTGLLAMTASKELMRLN